MLYNLVKTKLLQLVNRFFPASFNLLDSGSLVLTSFVINGITFAYNVYLGRRLPLADFGLIAVIGNLLGLLQIPLSTYSKAITHRAAYLFGKTGKPDFQNWSYFRRTSFFSSAIITILWLAAIPFLLQFFSITQALPLLILTPLWTVSVTSSVDSGFLMGVHKFKTLAHILLVESLAMLAVTVALVETGNGELLYLAIPASAIIGFFMGWYAINSMSEKKPSKANAVVDRYFPWKFFTHSLVTKIASIAFISIDLLLAKHFLDQQSAGEYALLALVGKMIFYASSLLGQFIIPAVSKEVATVGGNVAKVFRALFLPTAFVMLCSYIVLGVFGYYSIPLLLGENARAIVQHVPLYALGMACFGLSNMIVTYFQSRQKYGVTYSSFISIVIIVVGILLFHDSVSSISRVVSLSGIISLLLALLYRHMLRLHQPELPIQVGTFSLVKPISKYSNAPTYVYGLYQNSQKQKALGKYWSGLTRGFLYRSLKHEIVVSTILATVQKRISKQNISSGVRIPEVIQATKTNTSLLVLFTWIESVTPSQKFSTKQLVHNYELASEYLQLLGKYLTARERKQITERPGWQIVLLYPLVLLKAVIARPTMSKQLFLGFLKFAQTSLALLRAPADRLSHRDIHDENILSDNKHMYLIDHAFTVITLRYYEHLSLLASNWQYTSIRKLLLKKLELEIHTLTERKQCIGLGIWVATILLGEQNLPKKITESYTEALNYWTNQNA